MILLSELSRRRIRSIQKLIRVGKNDVAVVLRVDKEKGYIDLSKRRVSSEDIINCEEKYQKSKAVNSILRFCAEKFQIPLEDLYKSIAWPLSRKYGNAYEAFKLSIIDETVWEGIEPPSKEILNELKVYISKRLTPQAVKIRADVEVSCFSYEGIDAIKEALKAAEDLSTEQMEIKVKLVAAPLYVLTTQALDKQQGIAKLQEAIEKINETISKYDGVCNVTMPPKAVTATEDAELQALLESKELDNKSDSESDSEDSD